MKTKKCSGQATRYSRRSSRT